MKTSDLEPLGCICEGRLWPLSDADIAQVEATIGWTLPEDYKTFVVEWGASRPAEGMWLIDCGSEESDVPFEMFHGASPTDSLVQSASFWLDPLGLLNVARAFNGLFFLTPDGHVLYERAGTGKLHHAADSFASFVESIKRDYTFDDR